MDADLAGEPKLGVHPGENTATIFLSCDDVVKLIRENGNSLTMVRI